MHMVVTAFDSRGIFYIGEETAKIFMNRESEFWATSQMPEATPEPTTAPYEYLFSLNGVIYCVTEAFPAAELGESLGRFECIKNAVGGTERDMAEVYVANGFDTAEAVAVIFDHDNGTYLARSLIVR